MSPQAQPDGEAIVVFTSECVGKIDRQRASGGYAIPASPTELAASRGRPSPRDRRFFGGF